MLIKINPFEYVNDDNFRKIVNQLVQRMKTDRDIVIGVTGYEGEGKSTLAIWFACALSYELGVPFDLDNNVAYLPTEDEVVTKFNRIGKYESLIVDEAVKVLHKHNWMQRLQKFLRQMYATERSQNKISFLLIPRFRDFDENMRNHRIRVWLHVLQRGVCMVYMPSVDKDAKDPWFCDFNFKTKLKKLGKRHFCEIDINEKVSWERSLPTYVIEFVYPDLPEPYRTQYKTYKDNYKAAEYISNQAKEKENGDRKGIEQHQYQYT